MAARTTTSSGTEGQRTESAATPDVSADVAVSAPTQASDAPDAANVALRNVVRALARTAARRDWADAVSHLDQKEATNDQKNDAAT